MKKFPGPGQRIVLAHVDFERQQYRIISGKNRSLSFFSPAGEKTIDLPGQIIQAQAGADQNLLGLILKSDQPGQKAPGIELRVYDQTGQLKLQQAIPHRSDEPLPLFALGDSSGRIILAFPASNEMLYWDADGREIIREALIPNSPFSLERSMRIAASANGQYFAIATMREPARPQNPFASENTYLFLFAKTGTLLWQKVLPEQSLNALEIASDGSYVAISTYDAYQNAGMQQKSRIFARDGREIFTLPMNFQGAVLRPGVGKIFLFNKKRLWQVNLSGKKVSQLFSVAVTPRKILAACANSKGDQIVVLLAIPQFSKQGFQFQSPSLIFLNQQGKEISRYIAKENATRPPFLLPMKNKKGLGLFLNAQIKFFAWQDGR